MNFLMKLTVYAMLAFMLYYCCLLPLAFLVRMLSEAGGLSWMTFFFSHENSKTFMKYCVHIASALAALGITLFAWKNSKSKVVVHK